MSKDEDKEALLAFLHDVDWSKWIDDDEVKNHLGQVKERIESLDADSSKDGDADLSNATRIKLVVVGDGAVGKTSLLISFQTKKFPTKYVPTVFENYTAPLKRGKNQTPVLLHLWDTAGQEEYDRLRPLSYPNSDVVLLCFSTVNRASLDAIKVKWFPEVHHYCREIPKILVGTKVDLRDSGEADPHASDFEPVDTKDGDAMAKEIGAAKYVEVSAKTRKNLNLVFETAVDCVLKHKGGGGSSSRTDSGSSGSDHKASSTPARSSRRCVMM